MHFSDIYADRDLPEEVRNHEVLWGKLTQHIYIYIYISVPVICQTSLQVWIVFQIEFFNTSALIA